MPDRVANARRELPPLHARLVELRRRVRRIDRAGRLRCIGLARGTVAATALLTVRGLVSLPASIGTIGPWFIGPPPLAVALLLVLLPPLPSASLLLLHFVPPI